MNRFIKIPDIKIDNSTKPKTIYIDFENNSIKEWCLELFLLKEDLADSVTISDKGDLFKVEISLGKKLRQNSKAVAHLSSNKVKLQVTSTELDYWISFFLKYYRDGVAEVDHIDIETSSNPELFLTLK